MATIHKKVARIFWENHLTFSKPRAKLFCHRRKLRNMASKLPNLSPKN